MTDNKIHPVVLTILDGWGLSDNTHGNAINLANTPTMDTLRKAYPTTSLSASGLDVGLPDNQVGNSEVGHTSIGGGRIILQDLVKITQAIDDKSFYNNHVFNSICEHTEKHKSQIHLIGLCSDGGVHSHITHLLALLKLLKNRNIDKVNIHFISDGRDTDSHCAIEFIDNIEHHIKKLGIGRIATISGRYYAMDRDCRWSRTEAFYKVLVENDNIQRKKPQELIRSFYEQEISDEFIIPTRINNGILEDNDGIILFNFRPDRMRQICQALSKENFKGFSTQKINNLQICTFTQYDSTLNIPIAFKPSSKNNFLGEVISKHQLKQLRITETEKYAHVTYFFNGGLEEPCLGEDRELISSPQVTTYDESPSMSATQITESVLAALEKDIYSLIVINYANPDMVGHTGNLASTIEAIEFVDQQLAKLLEGISKARGTMIITADHGNAECMININQKICKSHTTNLVPFILIENEKNKIDGHQENPRLRQTGSLIDIAPTIIDILELNKPDEMTGQSLIEPLKHGYKNTVKL
uniref:2,3-bisphosphoglycerate-independent phosphoglycerate mutase n=1 Tax=Helminthocladia australis TaxID=260093 RepID=A0A1G4NTB9_9FLOR|nr:Phosphoglycerate mutase [Helminthocladia australis]SCW21910.1 Phosphoglycerate mutase [Helminthocladia australis]